MKKKISVLVSALASLSLFATACDNGHTHTFSDTWESDATNHWHAATCEHGEEKNSLAKHADADEDGKCDVCSYEVGHTHTYAEEWSKDATHHWKAATCTHSNEVSEKALHTDVAADGTCDVCGGHAHVVNKAGICDVCGEQVNPMDETNIEMVIAATAFQYKNVVSSEINFDFTSTVKSVGTEQDGYGYNNSSSVIIYTLGNDATYVQASTENQTKGEDISGNVYTEETESSFKKWLYADANDTEEPYKGIMEATDTDGVTDVSNITASADELFGYYYSVSSLADAYGAENILATLYELSQDATASDYTVEHDADENTYTFSFTSLIINISETNVGTVTNVNLFETTVGFEYSDNYVLTALYIDVDTYTNDAGAGSEDDITLEEVDGEWVKVANAIPNNYEFYTEQTAGTRTYTHTKSINEYIPTTFTFKNNGATIANNATLEYERGEDLEIDIECNGYFNLIREEIEATLTSDSGNLVASIGYRPEGTPFVSSYNLAAGEYTLTVVYGNDTIFTAEVVVTAPQVQGTYVSVTITNANTYTWDTVVSFTAPESGTYTFTMSDPDGACDKERMDANMWCTPDVTPYGGGGSFSVDIAAGDTYEFYVWSANAGELQIPYTFVAKDVQSGGNEGGGSSLVVATPLALGNTQINAADAAYSYTASANGTLTLTAGNAIMGAVEISYTVNGGTPTALALNSSVNLTLSAGDEVVITVIAEGYSSITAAWADATQGGDTTPVDITGTYYGTDSWGNQSLTILVEETTVTFNFTPPMGNPSSYTCDYTIDGDTVTLMKDGSEVNSSFYSLTIENGELVNAIYGGTSYTVASSSQGGGNDGGDDTNPTTPVLVLGDNDIAVSADDIENEAIEYSLVVENEGTYTFASQNLMAQIVTLMGPQFGSAYLTEGTYTINVITTYISNAGTYTLTVEYTAPETGDEGGEEGSEENPIVWTELPETVETTEDYIYYTWTATADGVLSVSWNTAVGCGSMHDEYWDASTGCYEEMGMNLVVTEGATYTICLACIEGTATATLSFQEMAVLAFDIYEESPVNTITVTATDIENGALQYALIVTDAGKYTLNCEDFATMQIRSSMGVEGINSADLVAGLYTVVILLNDVEAGEYELTVSYTYPLGAYENPIVWTELPETVETTEDTVFYSFTPTKDVVLTITWAAEIGCGSILDAAYLTSVYADGSTTMTAKLSAGTTYWIGLYAYESATATISLVECDGSAELPFTAVVGENTCNGSSALVWYSITVTDNCTITVSSDYVSANHDSSHATNSCTWLVISPEPDNYSSEAVKNTSAIGSSVSIEAEAYTTYYIGVADWCEAEAEIVFNVAITYAE